jgi:hypothetical protein
VCIYEGLAFGPYTASVFDPAGNVSGHANRWGAGIFLTMTASGNVSSYGTWAATTP